MHKNELINPCNLCFEREGGPKTFLPIYEGKVVNPDDADDYAYMLVCVECFEEAERQDAQARRPATRTEVEAMTAICKLQDQVQEARQIIRGMVQAKTNLWKDYPALHAQAIRFLSQSKER